MSNLSAPRLLAFDALYAINREGAYANVKLPSMLNESSLEDRDKAFCTELVYGTLRWQGKFDAIIKRVVSRPFVDVEDKIVDLLRLALYEIYEMRTPDRAVLYEYGEITKRILGESRLSFINAVLRKVTSSADLVEEIKASLAGNEIALREFEYSHPAWIIEAFYSLRKDWTTVDRLLAVDNTPASVHAIAYPGRAQVDTLVSEQGMPLHFSPLGVKGSQFVKSEALATGAIGIQDEGSQIVTEVVLATAEDNDSRLSWLDMCSGPGGKAALLYTWLKENRPEDTFLANEIHQHRADLVAHRVPRSHILVGDATDPKHFNQSFDRIVVDAPCTGLGALRRRPESRWRKEEKDLKELLPLQRSLLDSAVAVLKPGGIIAYITCSPHLWETQGQVLDLISRHKEMKVVSVNEYIDKSILLHKEELKASVVKDKYLQLWSDVEDTDSMFLAFLRKDS